MEKEILIGAYINRQFHSELLQAAKKDNRKVSDFIRSAVKDKIERTIGRVDLNGH